MGDSAVAQSVTKLVVVWPELSKYLRTCGQKMWNRHCSSIYIASIPAIATATTKNANFQSKQTKAKSNQSEPSRAGKSGNQFVKSNNWNGHERITHATGIERTSSRACLYKSKYFRTQRKQICFKSPPLVKGFFTRRPSDSFVGDLLHNSLRSPLVAPIRIVEKFEFCHII